MPYAFLNFLISLCALSHLKRHVLRAAVTVDDASAEFRSVVLPNPLKFDITNNMHISDKNMWGYVIFFLSLYFYCGW
jgi:hypothetical protein